MSTENHKLKATLLHLSDAILEVIGHLEDTPVNEHVPEVRTQLANIGDALKQITAGYTNQSPGNIDSLPRMVDHALSIMLPTRSSSSRRERRSYLIDDIPTTLRQHSRESIEADLIRISGSRPTLKWSASLYPYLNYVITEIGKVIGAPVRHLTTRVWVSQYLVIGQESLPEDARIGNQFVIKEGMSFDSLTSDRVTPLLSISVWAHLVNQVLSIRHHLSHRDYSRVIRNTVVDHGRFKEALKKCLETNESIRSLFGNPSVEDMPAEKILVLSTLVNEYLTSETLTRLYLQCTTVDPLLYSLGIDDNISSCATTDANRRMLSKDNIYLELISSGDFQIGIALNSRGGLALGSSSSLPMESLVCHDKVTRIVDDYNWGDILHTQFLFLQGTSKDTNQKNISFLRRHVLSDNNSESSFFNPLNLKEENILKINKICDQVSHTLLRISI